MRSYGFTKYAGIQPAVRSALDWLWENGGLPLIKGEWFFVDPESGTATGAGTAESPVESLATAYGLCTSGAGDGIVVLSSGTSGSTTTSYLDTPLTWSKWGITTVGICAGGMMGHRARVTNVQRTTGSITTLAFGSTTTITDSASGFLTAGFEVGNILSIDSTSNLNDAEAATITAVTAGTITCSASSFTPEVAGAAGATVITSYMPNLITLTGSNNIFANLLLNNGDENVLSVGGLEIQGNRNVFSNCQIYGASHATPAAAVGAYDLRMNGAAENTFFGCTIGGQTVAKSAANGCITFIAGNGQNHWIDCTILSQSSTAGHGAIKSESNTACGGMEIFKRCTFINWKANGASALTSAFIGTAFPSGYILMDACTLFGWAAWDSVGSNNIIYVANSAVVASGAGGIATTV